MRPPYARIAALTGAVAAGLVAASTAPPANAVPPGDPIQQQINDHVRKYPGGTRIGNTQVSYDKGALVLNFDERPPSAAAAPSSCPKERVCLYTGASYGGQRADLNVCGWYDLAARGWHDRTWSVYYNKARGEMAFDNHGAVPSHASDTFLFGVGSSRRAAPSLGSYGGRADHVRPVC
ncbi:peptidase inhibitor family I36 protein [Phytohabitans suffuscus]|uniref:Secreted protein n=1 Tax=Phytohabitans suffuscus TaxID=624315 RepID=A0A6F8YYU6_9ACTN|nr:peptidase inhibitor family I36 protein [Phytohabitans suffuscus]BCB91317.1 hypothetical protein Psuf_086300 [Phytohabitans suffuscus]